MKIKTIESIKNKKEIEINSLYKKNKNKSSKNIATKIKNGPIIKKSNLITNIDNISKNMIF